MGATKRGIIKFNGKDYKPLEGALVFVEVQKGKRAKRERNVLF